MSTPGVIYPLNLYKKCILYYDDERIGIEQLCMLLAEIQSSLDVRHYINDTETEYIISYSDIDYAISQVDMLSISITDINPGIAYRIVDYTEVMNMPKLQINDKKGDINLDNAKDFYMEFRTEMLDISADILMDTQVNDKIPTPGVILIPGSAKLFDFYNNLLYRTNYKISQMITPGVYLITKSSSTQSPTLNDVLRYLAVVFLLLGILSELIYLSKN